MENDLYAVLGVARDADDKQLRAAYRQQVKLHHPDVGGSPARFREIQQAYERLCSPEGRALHDAGFDNPPHRTAHEAGPATAGPDQPPGAPGPDDWVRASATRMNQARQMRQRLSLLVDQLVVADGILYSMYRDWTLHLSPADRARLRAQHDELVDRTAEMLSEARYLSEVLGEDGSRWPSMPTVDSVFSAPDEMGYGVPVRVWFTRPSDLVTGPLWLTPRLTLRLRSAWWSAATVLVAQLASTVLATRSDPPAVAELWARFVATATLPVCVGLAALTGAFAWPVLITVGALRRTLSSVASRHARWALGAMVLGATSALGWWWPTWPVAALWTLAAAAMGAAAALVRSALARWWVRVWTATAAVSIDAYLRRRRAAKGPRRASGRDRRRARRSRMTDRPTS